ncbi:hypothetical protein K488DRAFT_68916 [Vararia minispora EC-137]|uniref:Uncharacterized protein n=1 Tax=Vararia minispora EC-137 TaxID=1314806 RepID=A0ACB8QSD0_9AGAM|nr:hypothetical protein K488DRAFT_68916 [Vararia minispora EC-137]
MSYLNPRPQHDPPLDPQDDSERAERQRAVQKFLARAELTKLTRGLRTRLSYATYKATHNVSHLPFRDLEASARLDPSPSNRSGRGNNGHYDNPNTQGRNMIAQAQAQADANQRRGSMAPPTAIPPNAATAVPGRAQPAPPGKDAPAGANATQSLYVSILAQPPSAKRPRTIHNVDDPPAAPPGKAGGSANGSSGARHRASASHAHASTSDRSHPEHHRDGGSYTSLAERTRGHTRQTHPSEHSSKPASGGVKRKSAPSTTRTRGEKSSKRRKAADARNIADIDMDMKAAATLTDLLRSSRSSIHAGATSPRSTLSAGSDVGSGSGSFSYTQSSARTLPPAPAASPSGSFTGAQPTTPPRAEARPVARSNSHLTANSSAASLSAPADEEALRLLQFLHESPSPARPSRDAHDAAAFRALTSQGSASSVGSNSVDLHATGRVLFPTASGGPESMRRTLSRSGAGSFASTASGGGPDSARASPQAPSHEPTLRVEALPAPVRALSPSPKGPTTKVTPPTPTEERPRPPEYVFSVGGFAAPSPGRGVAGVHA